MFFPLKVVAAIILIVTLRIHVALRRNLQPSYDIKSNTRSRFVKDVHSNIPHPPCVHDPKFIMKYPRHMKITKNSSLCLPPGEGLEGREGYSVLKTIRKYITQTKYELMNKSHVGKTSPYDVKLFCVVYTHAPPNGNVFTDAIQETWGKRCDGFLFASNESNPISGHSYIPSSSIHGFGYKGMTQRTRAILAYIYDNFLEEYEYFHLCGDDTYVIVENLKRFLKSTVSWENENEPDENNTRYLFAGFHYSWGGRETANYLGGGSGYTLSKKALRAFVEGPLQTCDPYHEAPNEDMFVSKCFNDHLMNAKFWIDTRDTYGAHRYHQLSVDRMATLFPKKNNNFMEKAILTSIKKYVKRRGPRGPLFGKEGISNSSIAFHKHIDPDYLRRYELILYGQCRNIKCCIGL